MDLGHRLLQHDLIFMTSTKTVFSNKVTWEVPHGHEFGGGPLKLFIKKLSVCQALCRVLGVCYRGRAPALPGRTVWW